MIENNIFFENERIAALLLIGVTFFRTSWPIPGPTGPFMAWRDAHMLVRSRRYSHILSSEPHYIPRPENWGDDIDVFS